MKRILALLLALGAAVVAPGAHAQTPPPATQDSAAARAIARGQEALAAYERGEFESALGAFREADAAFHSPVFALYAGRCLRELGRLAEARAELGRVAAEPLPPSAPEPWQHAQADAQRELAEMSPLPAPVTVEATAAAPHKSATPSTTTRPPPIPLPTPLPKARGPYWPGWLLIGGGGLALASGAVVGALALDDADSQRENLPAGCQEQRCLARAKDSVESRFDHARSLALASDVLWISGAVLLAAGVTLVVVDPRPNEPPRAALRVSPTGAAFAWRF
jgi:hypothetical protein